MPTSNAVVSEQVFHYTGSAEFDELVDFMTYVMGNRTPEEITLQRDGSVRYYSGHNQTGSDYSTFPPGTWLTASRGVLTDAEFHEIAGPVPAWSDEASS